MRAAEVALTDEDRGTLAAWLAAGKTERRMAFRAQVILAVAEGLSNAAVAGQLGTRPATVSKWRGRFSQAGLSGLTDAPRSGKPRHYESTHERRILAALDRPPPLGYGRWDGSLLALQPPENALVFAVDEKPHIPAWSKRATTGAAAASSSCTL
jgi:hypothetical protein